MSQKRPCRAAASVASAADWARGWTSRSGQVPPYVPDVLALREEVPHGGLGPPAVRALQVAVLDERDRRARQAPDPVPLGVDRLGQVLQRLLGAEQCSQPHWLGQTFDHPEDHPGDHGGSDRRAEDPDLGVLELLAPECQGGDQQRHGESDAGACTAAQDRARSDRREQLVAAHRLHEPRRRRGCRPACRRRTRR